MMSSTTLRHENKDENEGDDMFEAAAAEEEQKGEEDEEENVLSLSHDHEGNEEVSSAAAKTSDAIRMNNPSASSSMTTSSKSSHAKQQQMQMQQQHSRRRRRHSLNSHEDGGEDGRSRHSSAAPSASASVSSTSSWANPDTFHQQRPRPRPRQLKSKAATTTATTTPTAKARKQNAPSSLRRQSRPTTPKHNNTTPTNDGNDHTNTTIPSKLLSAAGGPALQLLKLAGLVTLNTTGKIVAPPLHITRTVLLPALFSSIDDYARRITPQRIKDWFRIVTTGIGRFFDVLLTTHRGRIFRRHVALVGKDVVDSVSSQQCRQLFIDAMASWVKTAEALRTPETKALIEQMAVLGCRFVDVCSTGHVKQLMHDFSDAAWSLIELAADPKTTVALAEVTAYLCHALEMENTLHQPAARRRRRFRTKLGRRRAARRRHARNRHNARTYLDPIRVEDEDNDHDDDAAAAAADVDEEGFTVEEVILSSLGDDDGAIRTNAKDVVVTGAVLSDEEGGGASLPSGVLVGVKGTAGEDEEEGEKSASLAKEDAADGASSLGWDHGTSTTTDQPTTNTSGGLGDSGHEGLNDEEEDNDQDSEMEEGNERVKLAQDACDVAYLRERIAVRAAKMEATARMKRQWYANDDRSAHSREGGSQLQNEMKLNAHGNDDRRVAKEAKEDDEEDYETDSEGDVDIEDLSNAAHQASAKSTNEGIKQKQQCPDQTRAQGVQQLKYEQMDENNGDHGKNESKSDKAKVRGSHDTSQAQESAGNNPTNVDDDVNEALLRSERFRRRDRETAVSQFYRILDDIVSERRQFAIESLLAEQSFQDDEPKARDSGAKSERPWNRGHRSWYPQAAAAAGAGNERGFDTIRRLRDAASATRSLFVHGTSSSSKRAEIGVGRGIDESAQDRGKSRTRSFGQSDAARYSVGLGVILVLAIMCFITWFGFGCYGLYVFLFPARVSLPPPLPAEVVVRIVREVAHVKPDGLHGTTNGEMVSLSDAKLEKIVQDAAASAVASMKSGSKDVRSDLASAIADALEKEL